MKVQNDATSRLLIKCFMPFLLMKYMFHYYFFYRYKKCLPLVEDLDNESRVYALPLFSQSRGFLSRIIIILGANVVVFGDIRIGNNVTIGAGAVVNKDIPDNSVAYGNPLKIVAKNI